MDVLRRLKEEEILELKDLEAKRFRFKEWKHVKTSRDDIVVPRRGNFFCAGMNHCRSSNHGLTHYFWEQTTDRKVQFQKLKFKTFGGSGTNKQ